jgi:hypothetical protein
MNGMTPDYAWSGQKPSMSDLKVFGCIAYAWKLDGLKIKLVFLGSSLSNKTYLIKLHLVFEYIGS